MNASDEYQGLVIDDIYGNCPVQAEGTVDGIPFYFRARGQRWRIGIGGNVVRDPAWGYGEHFGDSAFEAGWMTQQEAETFIKKSFMLYREGHPGNIETSSDPADAGSET